MDYSKLKIFFCVAGCLTLLMSPFVLDITPDGKALALSSRSGNRGDIPTTKMPDKKSLISWSEYKEQKAENGGAHQVPEPATMLLIGSGLAGLAIFRRKFKK